MKSYAIVRVLIACGALSLVTGGCGAADTEPLADEPVGTSAEAQFLGPETFDPPTCVQAPTQCNGMHCCPAGMAMTGAHINRNTFRCQSIFGADESTCFVTSTSTKVVEGITVRACPDGFYMKGYHANQNKVTCCAMAGVSATQILDGHDESPTQTIAPRLVSPWPFAGTCQPGSMHACPSTRVMQGIDNGRNYFLCGS